MKSSPSDSSSNLPAKIITLFEEPKLSSIRLDGIPANDQIIAMIPLQDLDLLPKLVHFISVYLEERGAAKFDYRYESPLMTLKSDDRIGLSEIRAISVMFRTSHLQRGLAISLDRAALPEAEVWLAVLGDAYDQLYAPVSKVQWSAIVGPDPLCHGRMGSSPTATLASGLTLGNMKVSPGTIGYREELPCFSPAQIPSCKFVFISYPLQVHGVAEKLGRYYVSNQPLIELSILSSILSLVFERPWVVRREPLDLSDSFDNLRATTLPDTEDADVMASPPIATELPSWSTTAWELCISNQQVRAALLTYQEAVRMRDWHPSYALVAFMSALQTLGSRIKGNGKKQIRAALRTCLSEEKVTQVMRLYSTRGDTVHGGMLFGSEPYAGIVHRGLYGPFQADPAIKFHLFTLDELEGAVRSILIHHFENSA